MNTTNSLKQIVPGSKVVFQDKIYDVGEITEDSANLYLSGRYKMTVKKNDVKPI